MCETETWLEDECLETRLGLLGAPPGVAVVSAVAESAPVQGAVAVDELGSASSDGMMRTDGMIDDDNDNDADGKVVTSDSVLLLAYDVFYDADHLATVLCTLRYL